VTRSHHGPIGAPDPNLSEKAILARVRLVLEDVGCTVYSTVQTRRSHVSAGLPDLYVLHPKLGGFWIEGKAWHGKQSAAQVAFQHACRLAAVDYVLVRSVNDVVAYLRNRNLFVTPPAW